MKKFMALAIALTACMVSCGDDKGDTIIYNFYGSPSQADASKLFADVNAAASSKAPAAQPGSKEWCDAVADVLKNSNGLFLSEAAYTDDAIRKEIAYLNQNIAKCEKNADVTSFDWYTEAKKEVAASCNVPDGLKVKDALADLVKAVVSWDVFTDCTKIESDWNAFLAKYSKEVDYFELLEDACDTQECIDKCMNSWWPSNMDDDKYESNMMMADTTCHIELDPTSSNPCLKQTCDFNAVCIEGSCINACDLISCGPNATCNRNLGLCEFTEQPAENCTQKPSLCTSEQFCDGGICKPKPTNTKTCNDYTATINAIKNAFNTATSCDDLDSKMEAALDSGAAEGVDENVFEACIDTWYRTVDPAKLASFEECDEDHKPQDVCDNFPNTIAALKQLAQTAQSCEELDSQTEEILDQVGVPEGLTDTLFDRCWDKWIDQVAPSANTTVKACMEAEDVDVNCNNYPQGKAEFIRLANSIVTCEDVTSGIASVKGKLVTGDGVSSNADAESVLRACSGQWFSSLTFDEKNEISDKVFELADECPDILNILGIPSIGGDF